ncbi:Lysozyme-like domain protein [Beauveria brongniartii RCEF 3172]|uniref:Lysozyme-like domain protein n=1 Tax=Beauveria brongniartii RCEF 3172 TaxID=1081107 RepID=A0A162JDR3_9HYPO|nr:Lysozyme-like domain protein [Beauveria brongniartii RCEF 3172]
MKTFTSVAALFSLINGIAAYPLESVSVPNCQPGHLVCQGEGKFGICNFGSKAIFMDVSQGTQCVCSGSDCTIAALGGGSKPPQNTPVPTPSAPSATPSTSQAAPPTSSQAAPPTSSQAPPPAAPPAPSQPTTLVSTTISLKTPEKPASQQSTQPSTSQAVTPTPAVGGQFKEVPTATLPAPETSSAASSQPSAPASNPISSTGAYIKAFMGKGDASAGWPQESSWDSFDAMWDANLKNVIYKSCANFQQDNNSPAESADIKSAIEEVSKSSGVDARFILAVVMQESNGCVRAPTTANGVTNPGLMQSHNGANSCYNVKPCPKSTIKGMIEDGVNGTADGDGLKQLLAKAGGSGATTFYRAARMYNSGSIDPSGDLEKGIATHCYSSDIANRLVGWSAGVGACHA